MNDSDPPNTAKAPGHWAQALGHSASDKRIDILRGIGRSGSISQAAREAGVSYKAAWQAVATLSNLAGVPVVEKVVGGAGGGGARLTAQGQALLHMAQAYEVARRSVSAQMLADGRSASANASTSAKASDLGAAADRLRVRTSMRNQLPGVIQAISQGGRQARVQLRLGSAHLADVSPDAQLGEQGDATLVATITRESAQLLGLQPGLPAMALCKATAVQVGVPDPLSAPTTVGSAVANSLHGTVVRVSRAQSGDEGDEVTVLLRSCGLELVGFAAPGVSLRRRQRVVAQLDASAVVLALAG